MSDFCRREVEPMGVECDHVQIAALTEFLSIQVSIVYLENRVLPAESDTLFSLAIVKFPEPLSKRTDSSTPAPPLVISLLYRPGHYDVLYE